ncbi:MAG TPA: hypothetical protein VEF53_03825, partial [Patescibacteria group bacterium]|nr:hypothetical protein [Patescibacteria group bacterium]
MIAVIENKYNKSLYVDVSTFDNLTEKGTVLIALLSDILSAFVIPFNRSLIIHIEKINGRDALFRFNSETWEKAYKLLIEGEVQFLLITDDEERVLYDPDIAISMTCNHKEKYQGWPIPAIANNIAFSLSERLYNGIIPSDVQDKAVNMLKRMFIELNGVYGYITYEGRYAHFSPCMSSIERLLEMDYVLNSHNFIKMARGYHWVNILSEGHIEQLGGIDTVISSSPCNKVEKLE